jgi:hypothetical protein
MLYAKGYHQEIQKNMTGQKAELPIFSKGMDAFYRARKCTIDPFPKFQAERHSP